MMVVNNPLYRSKNRYFLLRGGWLPFNSHEWIAQIFSSERTLKHTRWEHAYHEFYGNIHWWIKTLPIEPTSDTLLLYIAIYFSSAGYQDVKILFFSRIQNAKQW